MAEFKEELGFTGQCGFELWFLECRIYTPGIGDRRVQSDYRVVGLGGNCALN